MTLIERIRIRLALALGRKPVATPCPPPDEIVAWQEGALSAGDGERVQTHVAHCNACFVLWTGLVETQHAAAAPAAVPSARPRWRWLRLALPAMAVAAVGIALLPALLGPGTDRALPAYALSVQGGLEVRGSDGAAVALNAGSALEIVLTPDSASDAAPEVSVFAELDTGFDKLTVPYAVTDKGVVVIDVVIGEEIEVPVGTQALWVAILQPGTDVDADMLAGRANAVAPVAGDGWRAWRIAVE